MDLSKGKYWSEYVKAISVNLDIQLLDDHSPPTYNSNPTNFPPPSTKRLPFEPGPPIDDYSPPTYNSNHTKLPPPFTKRLPFEPGPPIDDYLPPTSNSNPTK